MLTATFKGKRTYSPNTHVAKFQLREDIGELSVGDLLSISRQLDLNVDGFHLLVELTYPDNHIKVTSPNEDDNALFKWPSMFKKRLLLHVKHTSSKDFIRALVSTFATDTAYEPRDQNTPDDQQTH